VVFSNFAPHSVEYLFMPSFNYSQKLIKYKIDSILLNGVFFIPLHSFIQKSFRVENDHWKSQSCESFFPILPHYTPIIFLLNSSISLKFLWITKDVLLFRVIYDTLCVPAPIHSKVVSSSKAPSRGQSYFTYVPLIAITLTSRVTSTINSQSPVVRLAPPNRTPRYR
jgi:hypothetical protein